MLKPRTPAEKQQNKETLTLAAKIRAEREQEFKESMLGYRLKKNRNVNFLDYYQAYALEAYAKALKKKVRLVIWRMPGGKCKLFFSTKLSMTGEEVLKTYRTRFQIEFCYRDSKQFTGLMDCQARHKRQLDFAFNASFASLNAAKVFMKDNGMDNSMVKVKSLMFNANYTKLIFDMSRYRPNRTLINVSSTNLEQSKLCVNSPLYIDTRLLWEQTIGSNSTQ